MSPVQVHGSKFSERNRLRLAIKAVILVIGGAVGLATVVRGMSAVLSGREGLQESVRYLALGMAVLAGTARIIGPWKESATLDLLSMLGFLGFVVFPLTPDELGDPERMLGVHGAAAQAVRMIGVWGKLGLGVALGILLVVRWKKIREKRRAGYGDGHPKVLGRL